MRPTMMRSLALAAILGFAACQTAPAQTPAGPTAKSAHIVAAVADPAREADKAADADRKPAEMLAFAEVTPGDKVGDLLPGRGYFTRLFSKAVGPNGKAYAFNSSRGDPAAPILPAITSDKANYANVVGVPTDFSALKSPEPLDMIWTSRNYHDLMGRGDAFLTSMNKSIFDALKPGGVYIVLDHAAKDDATDEDARRLHRAKQAVVRRQVESAGFVYAGEDNSVRNPDDPKESVSEADVRGKTDQFVMKFRKPA
jgi:predicted methyltransferase